MNDYLCTCGFQAAGADQFDEHIGDALIPDDDVAPDGHVHAEAAIDGAAALRPRKACTCGFTGTAAEIDAHLLLAFAPDEGSNQHAAISARGVPALDRDAASTIV